MQEHGDVFLGEGHEHAERSTWAVIALCTAMIGLGIVGGLLFGSIALVADGLHMSTHVGALLLAALAYRYARQHARDARFTFGTGKLVSRLREARRVATGLSIRFPRRIANATRFALLGDWIVGDLAGFTSAIVLAMIALLVGWEALQRLVEPRPIAFQEAIPIACLGLAVNIASAWLLSGGHHHADVHGHANRHAHGHNQGREPEYGAGQVPRLAHWYAHHHGHAHHHTHDDHHVQADRHTGTAADRDNDLRAALIHVAADAAVSVLVILGLLLARAFGWLWMDPVAALVGAAVIGSWAYSLVRDTGRILLDMNSDHHLTERLRAEIEAACDSLTELHLWRLGPGHLGAVLAIVTRSDRQPDDYRPRLHHFSALSRVTVEVRRQ